MIMLVLENDMYGSTIPQKMLLGNEVEQLIMLKIVGSDWEKIELERVAKGLDVAIGRVG
jgi:hypothetical protein